MRLNLVLLLSALVLVLSCKKKQEDPPVEPVVEKTLLIEVHPVFGTETLYLDSVYSFANGDLIRFDELKFYFENPRNGGTQLIDAGLFDYRARGRKLLETKGNYSSFNSIQANIGIDTSLNHDDPSGFASASMLNIMNSNDMHWGWNPGYIFVKIEAKTDTLVDAVENLNHTIVYHVGLDANLQQVSFTNVNWMAVNSTKHQFNLELDMEAFFNGPQSINIRNEYSSHSAAGQEVLTAKVAGNFKSALNPM